MRLIHTEKLEFKEYFESKLPKYAVLSHCWDKSELSYRDFLERGSGTLSDSRTKKILDCCSLSKDAGLDWAWIDTCCIDKSSSAELSEAINSMFSWYERSDICLVFLSDLVTSGKETNRISRDLSQCRWFTRG